MGSTVNNGPIDGLIAGFKGFRAINYEKQAGKVFGKLARERRRPPARAIDVARTMIPGQEGERVLEGDAAPLTHAAQAAAARARR